MTPSTVWTRFGSYIIIDTWSPWQTVKSTPLRMGTAFWTVRSLLYGAVLQDGQLSFRCVVFQFQSISDMHAWTRICGWWSHVATRIHWIVQGLMLSALELCRLMVKSYKSDQPIANSSFSVCAPSLSWGSSKAITTRHLTSLDPICKRKVAVEFIGPNIHAVFWVQESPVRVLEKAALCNLQSWERQNVSENWSSWWWRGTINKQRNANGVLDILFYVHMKQDYMGGLWACFCRWVMAHVTFIARSVDGSLARNVTCFVAGKSLCFVALRWGLILVETWDDSNKAGDSCWELVLLCWQCWPNGQELFSFWIS